MIKQRIITSIVALPLLILLLGYANPAVFSVFVAFILFLSLIEFNRMGLGVEHRLEQWLASAVGALVVPLLYYEKTTLLFPLLTATILVFSLLFLFRLPLITEVHHRLGWIILGLIYLPFLLGHLIPLRLLTDGRQWIFLTLIAIMSCDTCAYFIGSKIGKRKLYPAVSAQEAAIIYIRTTAVNEKPA